MSAVTRLFSRALSLAVAALLVGGCERTAGPPKLVVVVTVDQMRADFPTRFAENWHGGFARLLEGGAVFSNASWSHAKTDTAPGHASIATGTHPGRHGIVGNDWWDREEHRLRYAVEDRGSPILGNPATEGRSPANLRRTTLGDWLKAASPRSRVFSVALKDRAAILCGGRRADAAYWYDPTTGRFVTSSYYRERYPDWVEAFNGSDRVASYRSEPWKPLKTSAAYGASREDDFRFEANGVRTTFPHTLDEPYPPGTSFFEALAYTPFADELTFEFARELIVHENLGLDDVPDLLWIGASAADYIGHRYGPYSREVQDHFLRLDTMLGDLLEFLDERVGPNGYVFALTSDHGVQPIPEELERRGIRAARIPWDRVVTLSRAALEPSQSGRLVPVHLRVGLFLDRSGEVAADAMASARRRVAHALREADFVADAYTYDELLDGDTPERPYIERYRMSFHRDRSPDVMIRFRENEMPSRNPTGTDHGSPYPHDRQVPMLLYGGSIVAGRYDSPVVVPDLAPTLAVLLDLQLPVDLDGRVLEETLR